MSLHAHGADFDPQPRSGLGVSRADKIRSRPIRWLWQDRLPLSAVTLLGGRGAVGKSTFAAALAAHVTGGPELSLTAGTRPKRGSVLWLTAEEGVASETKPRLKVAKARLSRVYFPGVDDDGQSDACVEFPPDLGKLEQLAGDLGVILVVVDPLASYCPGVDLNKMQAVRMLLGAMKLVADRVGLTWLCIAHPSKKTTGPVLDRLFGSAALTQFARSVLLMGMHPDGSERRVIVHAKMNGGKPAPTLACALECDWNPKIPRLKLTGEDATTAEMMGVESLDAGALDEHVDARALLRELLASGPMPFKDIEKHYVAAGISERTMRTIKAQYRIKSKRCSAPGMGSWCEWCPPANGFPPEGV